MANSLTTQFMKIYKKILYRLSESIKRFPFAISSAVIASILLIVLNRISSSIDSSTEKIIGRIILSFAFMIPLYLISRILTEKSKINKFIAAIIPLLISATYFFTLLSELYFKSSLRYGVLIFFLVTVFIMLLGYRKKDFSIFTVDLLKNLLITYIYALILFGGLAGIFGMIELLFDANINEKIYLDLLIVSMGIFGPIFYFSKIPSLTKDYSLDEYPIVFKILIVYIIMPIILIYTSILYVYLFRTVFKGLPDGLIANLILWYAMASVLVIFLVYPFKNKLKFAGFFTKYLPYLLIPLDALLFISIIIRINIYGFTINRYYVLAGAIFILLSCLYLILKKQANLITLALILSVISFISVIGPLSAFSITTYSQNRIFKDVLENNNMIEEGEIKESNDLSNEDKETIYSILTYFSRYLDLDDLNYIPKNFETKDTKEVFGFNPNNIIFTDTYARNEYFNYYMQNLYSVDIQNYDYVLNFSDYYKESNELSFDNYTATYHSQKNELKIYLGEKLVLEEDVSDLANLVRQKISDNVTETNRDIPSRYFRITKETEFFNFLYVFNSINGYYENEDDIEFERLLFTVYVDIK